MHVQIYSFSHPKKKKCENLPVKCFHLKKKQTILFFRTSFPQNNPDDLILNWFNSRKKHEQQSLRMPSEDSSASLTSVLRVLEQASNLLYKVTKGWISFQTMKWS